MSSGEKRRLAITLFQVKLVHTIVFWILSLCVAYTLFSGLAGHITTWTWIAAALIVVEGVVLAASGWTCPLTALAERAGAVRGSVADLFLPKWLADRIFPVCGTAYFVGVVLLLLRQLR